MKKKLFFNLLFLTFLVTSFFVSTAYFNTVNQGEWHKFGSPDESANYAFSRRWAETSSFLVFEEDNITASDIIRPRSYRSDYGFLKPVSFVGLPLLYGTIAKILGVGVLPYLTPFFGALGIFLFYFILRKVFSDKLALASSFLLAFFPVYFHYSSRGFFHNILFLVLFLASLFFLTQIKRGRLSKNWWALALSGIFLGGAVAVRSSELLWLAPLYLSLVIFYGRRISFSGALVFSASFFLAWSPALYQNVLLYGGLFKGGYVEMNSTLIGIKENFFRFSLVKVFSMVFYFGWHPDQAYNLFLRYFWEMFKPLALLASLGVFSWLALFWKRPKKQWLFFFLWGAVSVFLILYYGSWLFFDNPDPSRFTIGNSYTRYWLPFYLGAIVLAVYFIKTLASLVALRSKVFSRLMWGVFLTSLALFFLNYSFYGSEESLVYLPDNRLYDRQLLAKVVLLTENDAVIITRYHDKVFFPERKVIVGLFDDENMLKQYSLLAFKRPLYYFNFRFSKEDLEYLNQSRLRNFNLQIEEVQSFPNRLYLYRLRPL